VQCQALHARRELQSLQVSRQGEVIEVAVQGNAFLHHMVRNIVGSLILVGSGEKPVEWIAELLAGRDRTVAGPTAPPQGLVFLGPLYPDNWHLPAEVTL
jgi:tRNA pseudouridine38-40 synthase